MGGLAGRLAPGRGQRSGLEGSGLVARGGQPDVEGAEQPERQDAGQEGL